MKEETKAAQPAAEAPAAKSGGEGKSSAPFILSLIGGIFILLGGIGMALLGSALAMFGGLAPVGGGVVTALGAGMAIAGILPGVVVLIGAILMRNPSKAKIGAILVLVFSIISFFTSLAGGLFVGMILGIIGGALGLKK